MGKIIGDEPCPQCRSQGRDKTGNHLMIFRDGNKHCNRCGYTEKAEETNNNIPVGQSVGQNVNINVDKTRQNGNIYMDKFTEVQSLPIMASPRGWDLETATKHGVRSSCSESTGEIVKHYYPITYKGEVVSYRVRELPKGFSNISKSSIKGVPVELFGQSIVSRAGKRLLITGGQDDWLSADQMLKKWNPSVVSVTNGENIKSISDNLDFILSFNEVLLCLDNDDTGRACTEQAVKLIGDKARIVKISEKDANDMLLKGKEKEFINAYFKAEKYVPKELITVEDAFEEAIKLPEWGRKWPWPSLDKLTYGRRDGEGVYVGAGVKVGKTEFLSQMVDHVISDENNPVLLCKFEQSAGATLKALAGKRDKKQYHNPDSVEKGEFTQEELIKSVESLKDKVYMFNAGYTDAGKGDLWERIKGVIRYVVLSKGVKDIFIDPITQLTDGMDPSETETYLRAFSNEIQALSQELGFFYYIFCHLKSPMTGKTHEEGGRVKSAQFRGSRAMQEKTKFMIGIERNILSDDEDERNTSIFRLLLNSGFGKGGSFQVIYNPETTEYLEKKLTRDF